MKNKRTFKQIALLFMVLISVIACKKDKNEPTPPPAEVKAMTITELKALSTAASVKVPDLKKIKGIVISDAAGKNIDSKTIVLQEATGKPGIIITLDAANTFAAGDELEVTVSNQTLAQVNGEVVLQNVPVANVKKTGTGTVNPAETTISAILAAKSTFDGTLVKIAATELSGGNGKYTGTLTIKDASGTVSSNVQPAASFSETDYPASVSVITGIVRVNTDQTRIDIRKTDDVVIGSITKVVTENFENLTALVTGLTTDEDINNYGFKTKAGIEWRDQYQNGILPLKNLAGDASFTTAGRTYIYLTGESTGVFGRIPTGLGMLSPTTAGLKSVSITFALSKINEIPYLNFGTFPVDTFDPASDYLKIAIMPKIGNDRGDIIYPFTVSSTGGMYNTQNSVTYSPEYKEAGKFVTFTWNVPTKEALKDVDPAAVDQFLKHPSFAIYNASKLSGNNGVNVILFDKIVLNYGN
ncbi:MAG TPA: hypothetical protein ENO28_18270 [Bacteroidetes bacterium]|nr:hypothetical protein [Bacteroidota bacterium]